MNMNRKVRANNLQVNCFAGTNPAPGEAAEADRTAPENVEARLARLRVTPVTLAPDLKKRLAEVCKAGGIGVEHFGYLLAEEVMCAKTFQQSMGVPFTAMRLVELVLDCMWRTVTTGYNAKELLFVGDIGPRLLECMVQQPAVFTPLADSLGNKSFWHTYVLECALARRSAPPAAALLSVETRGRTP
jgi:hypothetical protein